MVDHQRAVAADRRSRCCGRGRSPPIIIRASEPELSCCGSQVPVTLPPRSTVAPVAQRADFVELVADVEDRAALGGERRSVSNSVSTACGVSTDVGSSMISSRGSCSRQRTIWTRWRSPTDIEWTCRSGSSGSPYLVDTSRMRVGRSAPARAGSSAECDVLGDRKRLEQREVLEYHADAELERLAGLVTVTGRPFQKMVPASGLLTP